MLTITCVACSDGHNKPFCTKAIMITLVNTQIFAEDILTDLGYIKCADSENGRIFADLALVFNKNAFFMKISLTSKNSIAIRLCLFQAMLLASILFA